MGGEGSGRIPNGKKTGRPKGSKSSHYNVSPAVMIKCQSNIVKAWEGRKLAKEGEKRTTGNVKTKIVDGYAHLKSLQKLTQCDMCAAKAHCPEYPVVGEGKERMKCPLWATYRNSIVDIMQNPLMFISKEIAGLKTDLQKQAMIDLDSGEILSKKKEKMIKLLFEAAKIANQSQKSMDKTGRRHWGKDDEDIVIDAQVFDQE